MSAVATEGLEEFEQALALLPDGYVDGVFQGRRWGATVKRSTDRRRIWLYAEELAGYEIVSFNLYILAGQRGVLKPCEMASAKVVDFVLGFKPADPGAETP